MAGSVYLSPASYSTLPALNEKFKMDVMISTIIVSVLSYFGYQFVTLVKSETELMTAKFLDIGKNTASIIHDLKGVLFSPTIYIEILEKKLKDNNELLPILGNLRNEFTHISEYVKSLNELSKSHGFESTEINIKNQIDIICNVLLKNRLKNIDLEVSGLSVIHGNFYQTKSSLINLFVNSLENFREKGTLDSKIKVNVESHKITYRDNGGGFPETVLKNFKKHNAFTTKKEGSGLGLFLIQEFMNTQGGDIKIHNDNGWAVIELIFNKENEKTINLEKGA